MRAKLVCVQVFGVGVGVDECVYIVLVPPTGAIPETNTRTQDIVDHPIIIRRGNLLMEQDTAPAHNHQRRRAARPFPRLGSKW